jgi:hypothetical protein
VLHNQALTQILAIQRKSVFATCLPLLRRKVGSRKPPSRVLFRRASRAREGHSERRSAVVIVPIGF